MPGIGVRHTHLRTILGHCVLSHVTSLYSFRGTVNRGLCRVLLLEGSVSYVVAYTSCLSDSGVNRCLLFIPSFFGRRSRLAVLPLRETHGFSRLLSKLRNAECRDVVGGTVGNGARFSIRLLRGILCGCLCARTSSVVYSGCGGNGGHSRLLSFFHVESSVGAVRDVCELGGCCNDNSSVRAKDFFGSKVASFDRGRLTDLLTTSSPSRILRLLGGAQCNGCLPTNSVIVRHGATVVRLHVGRGRLQCSARPRAMFLDCVKVVRGRVRGMARVVRNVECSLPPRRVVGCLVGSSSG